MKINQFEVWIANLNPRMGTEPGKIRPVVVIQSDLLNKTHPSTIICPITTKVERDSEILRVHVRKITSKLSADSDIMIDQLRAIDNRRLIKKTGEMDEKSKERIRESLRIVLDLE